jgi:predicted transcriptional regulator
MELKDYLYTRHIKYTEFAEQLGIDLSVFSRYINGKKKFSDRVARQIEIYTDGLIKAEELKGKK